MVDLMGLLSDALIGSFQMLMLNDLGKNMFPYVIHFDIDLLVADLKSIGIVLNDLAALYGDKYLPELPNNINFMNRVVNTKEYS